MHIFYGKKNKTCMQLFISHFYIYIYIYIQYIYIYIYIYIYNLRDLSNLSLYLTIWTFFSELLEKKSDCELKSQLIFFCSVAEISFI